MYVHETENQKNKRIRLGNVWLVIAVGFWIISVGGIVSTIALAS